MNIYIRYFDDETLVTNADEAVAFIRSIQEIRVDEFLERELRTYVEGNVQYPKRFKVSNRSYFIVIKTQAQTMEAFKEAGVAARDSVAERADQDELREQLAAVRPGWYEVSLLFKRVLPIPEIQKCQYVDTTFRARVKAESIQHCYNRVIEHLKQREDIDPRSQYPSIKGRNFKCEFVAEA